MDFFFYSEYAAQVFRALMHFDYSRISATLLGSWYILSISSSKIHLIHILMIYDVLSGELASGLLALINQILEFSQKSCYDHRNTGEILILPVCPK